MLVRYFRGGMDHWDPLITDGLTAGREVKGMAAPGRLGRLAIVIAGGYPSRGQPRGVGSLAGRPVLVAQQPHGRWILNGKSWNLLPLDATHPNDSLQS